MKELERVLHSERLDLEPLLPEHAPKLFEQLQDPRIYIYEPQRPPVNVSEFETRLERLATRLSPDGHQTWLNWAVRLRAGEYVGIVQATVSGRSAVIGYNFFPPHWGRGYAREACREMVRFLNVELAVHKLEAFVDTENHRSTRLLEAIGFTRVWTGPCEEMPGRTDYRYELQATVG